jgi:hypothetical protein
MKCLAGIIGYSSWIYQAGCILFYTSHMHNMAELLTINLLLFIDILSFLPYDMLTCRWFYYQWIMEDHIAKAA